MKEITYFLTRKDQIMAKGELDFVEMPDTEKQLIKVYPNALRQEIIGFGGAFTEAAAYTFFQMSESEREEILSLYFGETGNRYSLCRAAIQSCDFSLGSYSYISDSNDSNLDSFSLERDKEYVIPMILQAIELNPDLSILASPWSPPAFMKTNQDMCHGGSLKDEYYKMWADMIVRYIAEYRKLGIPIDRVTVQNEPAAAQTWDSCIYTSEQEKRFASEYLKKSLRENNLSNVKIAIWDHNKEKVFDRALEMISDVEADSSISGIAFHWYSGDHFESVQLTREAFPQKELIFTEGCVEYSRFSQTDSLKHAEMYAHDMIGTLAAGANGYIDWNLLLNMEGGPNHVGNFCDAPILCDSKDPKDTRDTRDTKDTKDTKDPSDSENSRIHIHLSYYYLGHISRFVLPGARRMPVSRYTDMLETVGFMNKDGQKVVIVLNRTEEALPFQLMDGSKVCPFKITARSIMTILW